MKNEKIELFQIPNAIELEQAILGAILIERGAYLEVSKILMEKCFYDKDNALIYKTIKELDHLNVVPDLYTVGTKLEGKIDPVYLVDLTERVGSASNIVSHSKILKQKYIERCMLDMTKEINKIALDGDMDVSDKIAKVNRLCTRITELTDNGDSSIKICDILVEAMQNISQNYERYQRGETSGIDTGIKMLTETLGGGFTKSEVTVLGARPAMGKTALMIHFAKQAALQGVSVQIYSLEMKDTELIGRMLVGCGGINSYHLRDGNINTKEWQAIDRNVAKLENLPIWVNDCTTLSMDEIRINAILKHRQGECGMILIDYLQLVKNPNDKGRSRNETVGEISRQAKQLAKELDVPVILLSQLSRDAEKDKGDKTPKLIHLRDSGEIEQNADSVLLLHRPSQYGEQTYLVGNDYIDTTGLGIIIVAKNRHGQTGDVLFSHNESLTEIRDFKSMAF